MATLPTRIRQNIRDHFTAPTSQVVQKTTALTATLGYPITLDPEWTMLWKTLQVHFPDMSTFVPSVARVVVTWGDAFTAWLENEENEEEVEKLLDALKLQSKLEIVIEISTSGTRPTTAWRANKSVFIIALAKEKIPMDHTLMAGFASDLLVLFTASPLLLASGDKKANDTTTAPDEDWADLDLGSPEGHSALPSRAKLTSVSKVEIGEDPLPQVSTIPRPEELLRTPPYWMVVRQNGRTLVEVQGSHGPSLACLDEYLRRWCRGEVARSDRPPMAEIKLKESTFGLGLLHDTLTIEATRGREVNAMLVLVFVENVLGYTPTPSSGSAGSVWEFRRMKAFK